MIYDIIVVGAGSGGLNVAGFMNKVGFKVLLVDKSDKNIGGDCLNYGCVPSKALIHVSRLVYSGKEAERFGLKQQGKIDIEKVKEYVTGKINHIRKHENASYFRKQGMDVVLGAAEFIGRKKIKVKNKIYSGKKIIIATGGRPRKLKIPGIEKLKYGKEYLDNESVFDINFVPKKLVIIGGGPIGMELGQALSRLGCKVAIVQREKQFLPKESQEVSEILMKQFLKEGMQFYCGWNPIEIKGNEIIMGNKQKQKKTLTFDSILVAIGRELNIPKGLEKAGVKLTDDQKKIKTDQYLRTANKDIYLCGDIVGGLQFTHAAELHASVILNNFFSPLKKKLSYDKFSWVTYTDPEIATFGLREDELKERNINYEKLKIDLNEEDRELIDENEGSLILFLKKRKILGGTMVGKNAGELCQELILTLSSGLKINDIFNKIYPYPTSSRINKKIISKFKSSKLTGFGKKILKFLY
ncbi:NAD(P)/FAD-dependent oxidoreductase [Candidatus Peregrinibacteria bacterium]|nr:NAD(P)/FAD-dependent oxidoreductase [Candidatus Peregrinibacteria bacterium]